MSLNNSVTPGQASAIAPPSVREYALANGWRRVISKRKELAVFQRLEDELDQLLVPMDPLLDDYGQMVLEVIGKLASTEKRPAAEIFADLLSPESDTFRSRVVSAEADKGRLHLNYAIDLLEGVRRCVLSAACSVVTPQKLHPRLSRAEAEQLVKEVRMNHSEHGSYTLAISLPLRTADGEPKLFDAIEPFTRQTTSLLMRSVARLVDSIDADAGDAALENRPGEPVISANLCEALLRMEPEDERATVHLSMSWAPALPQREPTIPQSIKLRREHFARIADLYGRLRPMEPPTPDLFIASVESLDGEIGPDHRRQGDVELLLMEKDGGVSSARAYLTADQYAKADRVHMNGGFIRVNGILERRRRIHRLSRIQQFEEVVA